MLDHPRIADPRPTSAGAVAAHPRVAPEIAAQRTGDFGRLDYVLPSENLLVVGSGVYWPADDGAESVAAAGAGDHRLVWIDIQTTP